MNPKVRKPPQPAVPVGLDVDALKLLEKMQAQRKRAIRMAAVANEMREHALQMKRAVRSETKPKAIPFPPTRT